MADLAIRAVRYGNTEHTPSASASNITVTYLERHMAYGISKVDHCFIHRQ